MQSAQHHRRMLRGQADVGAAFCDEHTAIILAMQTTVGATTATQHRTTKPKALHAAAVTAQRAGGSSGTFLVLCGAT